VPSCISAQGFRQAPRGAWMNSRQEKKIKKYQHPMGVVREQQLRDRT